MRHLAFRLTRSRICAIAVALLLPTGLVLASDPAAAAPTARTAGITPGNDLQTFDVTAGQPVSATFAATAGRIPTVEIVDDTLARPATLALLAPDGRVAASVRVRPALFRALPTLTVPGTWSLRLTPAAGDSGQVTYLLTYAASAAKNLRVGADRTVSLPRPGEVQQFLFTGRLQHRPTLTMGQVNWTSAGGATQFPGMNTDVYRPDGTRFGDFENICGTCSGVWREIRTLGGPSLIDATGVWSLVFRGSSDEIGSQTFHLGLVADQRHALTPGATTTTSVKVRGQNVRYTFTGTAGQRPAMDVLGQSWTNSAFVTADLLRPDGSEFQGWSPGTLPMPATNWFEFNPLDATGTWTFVLDPQDDTIGTQKMVLNLVTDPAARPVDLHTPVTVSLPQAGQNQDLTFTGTPGQRIVTDVSASSWSSLSAGNAAGSGSVAATLYGPDGSFASTVNLPASGSGTVDLPVSPAAAGTWHLRVDPGTDSVGSLTMSLGTVTDATGPLTLGQPVAVTLDQPYQQGHYSFTLPSGSWFGSLTVQGSTFADVSFRVVDDATGQTWGSAEMTAPGDATLSLGGLFVPGGYHLIVDPAGTGTGSLTATLTLR